MTDCRYDILIIGGGPVGLYAAFYAGLRAMRTLVMDSLPALGGQLAALYPEKPVYDMPGYVDVRAGDLAQALITQGLRFQPDVLLERRVTGLSAETEGWVVQSDSEHFHTRTVLIATGAGAFAPRKLDAQGAELYEGRGVWYMSPDLKALRGRRVLVVGGGDSAVDWALQLAPVCQQVTLAHRSDRFRAMESGLKALKPAGVEVLTWCELVEVRGDGQRLTAVTLRFQPDNRLETRAADAVIGAIGFQAGLRAYETWGLAVEDSAIPVDAFMRTNLSGVFAAGDIVTYPAKLKLLATGMAEAAIAVNTARTLIDPEEEYFPGHSSDLTL